MYVQAPTRALLFSLHLQRIRQGEREDRHSLARHDRDRSAVGAHVPLRRPRCSRRAHVDW